MEEVHQDLVAWHLSGPQLRRNNILAGIDGYCLTNALLASMQAFILAALSNTARDVPISISPNALSSFASYLVPEK